MGKGCTSEVSPADGALTGQEDTTQLAGVDLTAQLDVTVKEVRRRQGTVDRLSVQRWKWIPSHVIHP